MCVTELEVLPVSTVIKAIRRDNYICQIYSPPFRTQNLKVDWLLWHCLFAFAKKKKRSVTERDGCDVNQYRDWDTVLAVVWLRW